MEKWRTTCRLLRYSSRPLFDFRPNPNNAYHSYSGLENRRDGICKEFKPYFRRQKENVHSCLGFLNSAEIRFKQAFMIQYRSFGSVSTKIQRNPSFANLNEDDINYFKEILGEKNVIQDEDRLLSANTDWMHKYAGASRLMLQPRTTNEMSQILQYCNFRCLAVVPQGGNTGLVGGSVPVFDEVIINMGLMNNIIAFDQVNGILVCEAGCILENLGSFLNNEG